MINQTLKDFKKLKNDEQRWKFVIENQDKGIIVHCDNDDTFITIEDSDDDDNYDSFDNYIGWSDGVFCLLRVMGIRSESV
tara:strand:- start:510 stop:749 length:240 start_codon:yes stop_codon:yes gene_type:complete